MKDKETLEKLRTYQIGVIRSVIASRQGRQAARGWQIRTASPMKSITSHPLQSDTTAFIAM